MLGATGLVGGHLVDLLLSAGAAVRAAGRRPPEARHARLGFVPLDFEALLRGEPAAAAPFAGTTWVAICLGTTLRRAGSREAFRRVDHDYVLAAAERARAAGARRLAVVSSVGADPSARSFYLRVKGETERDLIALGVPELVVARPSLLSGGRREHRPGERWALRILGPLGPVLRGPLAALAPIPAEVVARALCRLLLAPPGDRAGSRSGPTGDGRSDDPDGETSADAPAAVRILEPHDLRALGAA